MIKKIICALPFYKQEYRSMSQVNFKLWSKFVQICYILLYLIEVWRHRSAAQFVVIMSYTPTITCRSKAPISVSHRYKTHSFTSRWHMYHIGKGVVEVSSCHRGFPPRLLGCVATDQCLAVGAVVHHVPSTNNTIKLSLWSGRNSISENLNVFLHFIFVHFYLLDKHL
jgi:hypothetical protein